MSRQFAASLILDSKGEGKVDIAPDNAAVFWRLHQVACDAKGAVLTVWATLNERPCTSSVTGASPLAASGEPYIDTTPSETFTLHISAGPKGGSVVVTAYYEEIQGLPT